MVDLPQIHPLGDGAVTITFGNEISVELNDKAISLADWFQENPFPGFVEAVPAYSSVAIFYNLVEVRRNFPEFNTGFEAVHSLALSSLRSVKQNVTQHSQMIEIPVDFRGDSALDLAAVAGHCGLAEPEVIDIFTSVTYRVFMLGFLPGFAYMGEVDDRIAMPRRESPRTKVPKGSVGIAGRQTGVYPLESPGGWQIIGRTELELFMPERDKFCLLRAGDLVRFRPVN